MLLGSIECLHQPSPDGTAPPLPETTDTQRTAEPQPAGHLLRGGEGFSEEDEGEEERRARCRGRAREMAAMIGARRALLAARVSPRGAIAVSAAPVAPNRLVDSPPRLPAEKGCMQSWVPHRGAGSFASEQTDEDCHRELGQNNAGSYCDPHSNFFNHQLHRDAPPAGSIAGVHNNRGVNVGGISEQPYRSGGSYGFPNSHQPYTGAGANNEAPGYNASQTYRGSNAYSQQNLGGDFRNNRQHYNGAEANSTVSGYSKWQEYQHHPNKYGTYRSYGFPNSHQPYTGAGANNEAPGYNASQTYRGSNAYSQQNLGGDFRNNCQHYNGAEANSTVSGYSKWQGYHHHPNKYGTYSSGYSGQSNQKNYKGEGAITGQHGYGPPGPTGPNSVGNNQQVFQKQLYVDNRSRGSNPDAYGNPAAQYANQTHSHKEHVAGFQRGNNSNFGYSASQEYQSHYATSQAGTQTTTQGYSMYLNADVQRLPHGVHQEQHSHAQPAASFGGQLNSAPHEGGIYYQSLQGNLSNVGSPYEPPNEVSSKHKGTVEELEKLCEDGNVKEALEVLAMLQENRTVLHAPQYFRLMQACGDATALEEARVIHSQMSESSLVVDTDIQNRVLEMYAKCGSMEDAKKLFSSMDHHNLSSWNTMISGFVHNGLGGEATDFFDQFKKTGDKPDSCMFRHVFLACGILGSVNEGMLHFKSMQKDFGIHPTMEHYASIVSMLGQSGYIAEAYEFVEQMPVEPSLEVWENLMNMSRLNGFLELGDRCAQIIERLDSSRLNEQSKMGLFPVDASDLAKEKERKKASVAEARSKVHEYRAGDRSHPDTPKIYEELRYLSAHMKEAGYIADTRFVLHDVDQETKEDALLAHSERLAISYGLITSAARSPIRVIKNLRSCGDCHTAFKIISKLVGRLIIARDAKRFHHFENGVCSCKDYW
ncbi:hypothetical protein U9M48_017785 [Paspalum notatum var. saurae]|uniref:DYW domain-containing protein n=1 Tax=Paspalum notatum var. saurae TaxID=547442 RepID=A0AAQ3T850_PASNO